MSRDTRGPDESQREARRGGDTPSTDGGSQAAVLEEGMGSAFGDDIDVSSPGRVLFVRDEADGERPARRLEEALDGLTVTPASGREEALHALPDVECVVSGRFEQGDTIAFVETVREHDDDLPFVLVPDAGSEEFAADAIAAGVTEYLPRDGGAIPFERVATRIEEAVERYREARASQREQWVLDQVQQTDPASTILIDEEGRCVWANDRARDRLALDDRDDPYTVGDTDVYDEDGELIPPEERPYYRVFETSEPIEGFECRVDLDEGTRWISINAAPIEGLDGDSEYAVISSADITDRKRYERELEREREELEAELSEVFERVSDAFYAVDEEFRFTYVNERAEELLQASEEELLGRSVWEAYPEATETDAYEAFHDALENQEPTGYELYFEPLDFWVDARVYPSETGLSVYFRDVTDRKRFEERLEALHRMSENFFGAESDRGVSEAVVDVVTEVVGLSGVVLYRHDPVHDELYPSVTAGQPLLSPEPIPKEGVVARVFEEGEPRRVHDLDAVPWESGSDETALQSAMVVPIQEFGAIVAVSTDDAGFDRQTERLVEIVASNAATAYERVAHAEERRRKREHLQVLTDIDSLVQGIAEAVVRQSSREEIERLVCERLAASASYDFAWLGTVNDGHLTVEREAGVENYLGGEGLHLDEDEREPAVRALRSGEITSVEAADDSPGPPGWRDRAMREGFQSSIAVPITFEGDTYGVLGVHVDRKRAFGDEERDALARLGTIVAHAIQSVDRERRLRENERRYRTILEHIPNGSVVLIDEDLKYLAVGGENLNRYDLEPEDLVGTRLTETEILSPELRDRLASACRVALDGEEVSLEFEFRGRTLSSRIVPVREEGDVHSAMIFSQDVTERRKRREQLEHERERLEFMNRLIRHNLLNSLNVVDARLDLLAGHVDYEVADHLETARERTGEMIDLIETIRSLMRVIVDEEGYELEPIAVDDLLAEQVEAARQVFPDAEFDLESEPVAVMADGLLEEAIENLLVNAVEHNDREEPRVDVIAEPDGDSVRIVVADNGPGIPDDLKSRVFEKGEQGFESPGTGFGLHLVREIVNAYGGEIRIEDNQPRGAVFEITLTRA